MSTCRILYPTKVGMIPIITFVVLIGNREKYKQKPVSAVGHVGRYKKSLYFSLVPTL